MHINTIYWNIQQSQLLKQFKIFITLLVLLPPLFAQDKYNEEDWGLAGVLRNSKISFKSKIGGLVPLIDLDLLISLHSTKTNYKPIHMI